MRENYTNKQIVKARWLAIVWAVMVTVGAVVFFQWNLCHTLLIFSVIGLTHIFCGIMAVKIELDCSLREIMAEEVAGALLPWLLLSCLAFGAFGLFIIATRRLENPQ